MSGNADILSALEAMRKDFSEKFTELNGKLDRFEKSMSEWQKEKAELINKQQEPEARLDHMER